VSLFKRRGSSGDAGDGDGTDDRYDQVSAVDEADDDLRDDETDEGGRPARARGERTAAQQAAAERRALGPRDVSEVEDVSALLDLGSILVAPTDGMELRLELNEEDGEHVVGVTALIGDAAVQVQAFAAPRSEGIWDEVRDEIAAGITQQGGTADLVEGAFGPELLTRVPAQDANGRSAFQPARFVGIDGPRWFLRAVVSGRAAIEPAAAEAVHDIIRTTVVDRGSEAMPPRELLPLRLPDAEGADQAEAGEVSDEGNGLNPFDRGPEITEVR
jgi:hypothetical protein